MPRLSKNDRERAIGMLQSGLYQTDVARRLGVHRTTIARLWSRFNTTGSTDDRPRLGQPRATTQRQDRYIRRLHLRERFQFATVTARTIPGRRRVSAQTIRNRLRAVGLRARRPFRGPTLTANHRQRRLNWAQNHVRWRRNQWNNVLFSDESRFCLRTVDGRRRVYRRRGERYRDDCVERRDAYGGGSVMIWAGINARHKTDLVFVNGRLTGVRYRDEILNRHVVPFIRRHGGDFQHDNARPHVARVCMDFLQRQNINVLPWPALSADMSPIEHLWDMLGRCVRQRRQQPDTLNELRQALVFEWQRLPQRLVRRLIGSMRRRCQALIAARGGYTKY